MTDYTILYCFRQVTLLLQGQHQQRNNTVYLPDYHKHRPDVIASDHDSLLYKREQMCGNNAVLS